MDNELKVKTEKKKKWEHNLHALLYQHAILGPSIEAHSAIILIYN